jgi:hypothetical protein
VRESGYPGDHVGLALTVAATHTLAAVLFAVSRLDTAR